MKNEKDIKKNIATPKDIRDDLANVPAVRVQAVQTMQKLIGDTDPKETEKNIKVLRAIRDDESVNHAVRIQTIQTMHKIFEQIDGDGGDSGPTEADIMEKIRGRKK